MTTARLRLAARPPATGLPAAPVDTDLGAGKTPFGGLLRRWRRGRGLSQLDLSLASGVSTRHLSCLETGRAMPSREMVLSLAEVLDVPLRARNALLEAAGFAARYRETALEAPSMEPLERAVSFLLERHLPYPAVLVDRAWNLRRWNDAVPAVFGRFLDPERLLGAVPLNVVWTVFDPDGLRPFVRGWEALARSLLGRVQREFLATGDPGSGALLERLLASDGVPEAWASGGPAPGALDVLLPLELERDGLALSLFTTITTVGTPLDVTAEELRVETLWPADDATDRILRELVS